MRDPGAMSNDYSGLAGDPETDGSYDVPRTSGDTKPYTLGATTIMRIK